MWPFRRNPLLDADTARWHLDNFAWLIRSHGGRSRFAEARLVLPAPEYFAAGGLEGHALALRLFDQVKAYCGLEQANVRLVQTNSPPSQPGRMITPQIAYAARLLENPQSFIATMAHELAHHVLAAGTAEAPPIERDEDEHLTDLTAVYLGFGVFLANSAFNMKAHADGWSYSRQGYLPEQDLVFGLALFLKIRQLDPAPAVKYLKAELGSMLRLALRDLQAYTTEISAMRLSDPDLRKKTEKHLGVVT